MRWLINDNDFSFLDNINDKHFKYTLYANA